MRISDWSSDVCSSDLSIEQPFDYLQSNLTGHLVLLEMARGLMDRSFRHLVYASSSSVYGSNRETPFSVEDRADRPMSFYGATKKCNEVMSYRDRKSTRLNSSH